MIIKYTFRLIKSTFKRFFALLAIVFIGVSFMMGLRSNYDIMKDSVEKYVDDSNLYDIQIYSNVGFDHNDYTALKNLDCVKDVFASKTRDVYAKKDDSTTFVARVIEQDSNLNTINLKEGRLPKLENECLIITSYVSGEIKMGETLSFYLDNEDISTILKNPEFKVVGVAVSPEIMSKTFSSSLLDNKLLEIVVYVPNSNFVSDFYSCMYLQLDGTKTLDSFEKEYQALVDDSNKVISSFSVNQSQVLKNKILEEATKKLEEGKAEFETKKAEGEASLEEGKAKLDEAKKEIEDSEKLIKENERKLPQAEKDLADAQTKIDAGRAELAANESKLNDAVAQIERYDMSVDTLRSTATSLYDSYSSAKAEVDSLNARRDELVGQRDAYQTIVDQSGYSNIGEVRAAMALVDAESEEYARLQEIETAFSSISSINQEINSTERSLNFYNLTLSSTEASIRNVFGFSDIESGYQTIISSCDQIESGQAQIAEAKAQLEDAQRQVDEGRVKLKNGKKELEKGKEKLEEGKKEYEEGLKEYAAGKARFELEMQNAQDQLSDAETQIEGLKDVSWHILNRYNTNYSFYMYKNTCEQMNSIGLIIPLLFFVVAALVCSTTMTRLIDEQRGQIGIYRAIGFRKKEIRSIYLLYVVIASLSAAIVAVFAGVFMFPTVIYSTWRLMYELPKINIFMPIDDLLLCVSCFTLLMVIVTTIVINKSLTETSSQLLRPKAPRATKQIFIEKWKWLWNKFKFTTKVTARNILRYKARFFMTVIGVAGCTSLLLMGFGIKDSITSVVSLQFGELEKYNYNVALKNDRHIYQILRDIKLDKNNKVYLEYCQYNALMPLNDKDVTLPVRVVDASRVDTIFKLEDVKTKNILELNNEGILISKKFCEVNKIKLGDQIDFISYSGETQKVKVVGIIANYVGDYAYISEDLYKDTFDEEIEYTNVAVINNKDNTSLMKLTEKYNDVSDIMDITTQTQSFNDMLNALNLVIIVIIIVAGALAFVVLINLTNVNISERVREIATLKVLGFRANEVNSYIFKEVLLMSIIGAIIGLPLGVVEEKFIMTVIDMEMCTFPTIIFFESYIYAFVITIIFTIIVLLITRKTLRKIEMIESLKSVE